MDQVFLDRLIAKQPAKVDPLASKVGDYLKDNYPSAVLGWVPRASWKLTTVRLADIDMARRPGGRNPSKVAAIAEDVQRGRPTNPVVLVDDDNGKYELADGYHRTLAFERAGKKTIRAYVASGDVEGFDGKTMHAAKLNVAPGEKAAEATAPNPVATPVNVENQNTETLPRQGAYRPPPPTDSPQHTQGYPTANVTIKPSGKKLHVMVADSPALRQTGLANRDDLGDYDGMLFRWPGESNSAMHNAGVNFPVSVAWFDSSSTFRDSAHMLPQDGTPVRSAHPFTHALELHSKDWDSLGLGPGASISVADDKDQSKNGTVNLGD